MSSPVGSKVGAEISPLSVNRRGSPTRYSASRSQGPEKAWNQQPVPIRKCSVRSCASVPVGRNASGTPCDLLGETFPHA